MLANATRLCEASYGLMYLCEGDALRMAALHGDKIVDVSLKEATAELKTVPPEWYDVAKAFFG